MSSTGDRRTPGPGIRQASRMESHLNAECLGSPVPGEVEAHSDEDANRRGISDDRLGEEDELLQRKRPWWKRPSPWWLLAVMPFNAIALSSKMAPRIEIYTTLACAEHRPDIAPRVGHGRILQLDVNTPPEIPVAYVQFPEFHFNETIKTDSTPPNWKKCAADPVVQASVAKLIAVVSTCSGILGLLTTGWWGSYSDRHGRTRVLLITAMGNLISDVNFILVTNFHAHLPGGYWFLVVGSIIDGTLGGFTTGVAAHHTYLTDTTDAPNRSRILSFNIGLLFTGMAIGPTLGSLLIRATGRTLSVFYMAVIVEFLYTLLLSLILPESITKEQMTLSRAKYHADPSNSTAEQQAMGVLRRVKRTFSFFSPLTIFMPLVGKSQNALRKPRRDWTLTMLVIAYGITISVMGSLQFKFQFAASAFGWTSEQIGYWLSLLGATRAFVMTAILPVAIKVLKPKPVQQGNTVQPTQTEASPLLEVSRKNRKTIELPSFDLNLARCSLLVDVISYFFMAIAQNAYQFTISAMVGSFGLGFNPAMQSATLALYTHQGGTESGRLFGALSVVQAISSDIVGPSLYGFVYARTVATFPRAIFYVTVVTLIISSTILLLVRLPKEDRHQTDPEESQ